MDQFIKLEIESRHFIFKWVEGTPDYIENESGLFLHYPAAKYEVIFSFDKVIARLRSGVVDCNDTLDIINLMNDFGFNTKALISDKIYQKLFWGCNLPSVTPDDKEYEPVWEDFEIVELLNCI